jgi:hypothetical protein
MLRVSAGSEDIGPTPPTPPYLHGSHTVSVLFIPIACVLLAIEKELEVWRFLYCYRRTSNRSLPLQRNQYQQIRSMLPSNLSIQVRHDTSIRAPFKKSNLMHVQT